MTKTLTALKTRLRRALVSRAECSATLHGLRTTPPDGKVGQLLLQQQYKALARTPGIRMPTFQEVGFRQYSQFEEDGILLYLFSLITPRNRTVLEICAGDGIECNGANLIINHGWWGHLFDGDINNVQRGTEFYRRHGDTSFFPPKFTCGWITAENVNQLILDSGLSGNIDLLSLDMDGVDYWVWKAITVVEPTVVVCEVHNPIPPELALTVPYNPKFAISSFEDGFRGASLRAMVNLGRSKGYRLVGVHRFGFNAFFVKNGVCDDLLPEVTPEDCAQDPYTRLAQATQWPALESRQWVQV